MKLTPSKMCPIVLAFALSTVTGSVFAQDGDADPLAAEAMLLEKEAQAPKIDHSSDPAPKMLAQVKSAEKAVEERLNTLQSGAETFLDIVDGVNAATNRFMTVQEKFFGTHDTLLNEYRTAEAEGNAKASKKAQKKVKKLRKKYLAGLKKINKKLDRLAKLRKKLEKRAAREDAAAAKKKAAEAPDEEDAENSDEDEGE